MNPDLEKIMEESFKELSPQDNFLETLEIPKEFYTIMNSFINDIKLTFPEYTHIIQNE